MRPSFTSVGLNHTYPFRQVQYYNLLENWIEEAWIGVCDGNNDPISIQAVSLVIRSFYYDKLVPVVDIIRYRNHHWLNTHTSSVHEGIEVNVRASHIIE